MASRSGRLVEASGSTNTTHGRRTMHLTSWASTSSRLFLSTLEMFYAPERYAARVLMSEALNIPPICQGIPRSLAAMATMAMS